jgi:hypothetical protein
MEGSQGALRGILMGVKEDILEVGMVLRHSLNNFRWEMLIVYGHPEHSQSMDFIAEMSRKCMMTSLPIIIGGDFNLIRSVKGKNTGRVNIGLMEKFNMFIDLHQLQEIKRNGSRFTWTNKQVKPMMVNLDIILVSTEWEARFPLCFAWSRTRTSSDHWPIMMDSGENLDRRQKTFYFEKQWLGEEDFLDSLSGN